MFIISANLIDFSVVDILSNFHDAKVPNDLFFVLSNRDLRYWNMEKTKDLLTFHKPDLTTRQELPVAGGDVKAGFPSPADDFLDSPLDLNRELVHNPASTFFVRVSGDSMAGDGIGDGDLLVVDRSVEPYDGCIAVCYVDGEFTVKRVRLEKGCAWLMPSNPKYRPIRVDAENDFQIWGIVRHVIKTFK